MATRAMFAALLTAPVFAQGPLPFALWRSSELQQRDAALSKKVGADHSARETLADYKSHRFRLLYRDGDGFPEQHDNIVDVVFVQSGEGTLVLGGAMVDMKAGSGPGEYVGTDIKGGERHSIGAGDVMHIPPTVPHRFLVPAGKHITYVLVKFPAP
jgi:mannose-6-phosphate isomerase-like protein (cupin superfamily)